MKKSPSLYIIAGPNGAGKTTFALRFLPQVATVHFINADLIASGLSPLQPSAGALEAGRVFLRRLHEFAEKHIDFAFETTLSGRTYITLIKRLRSQGYKVHMIFLWLPSVELALRRVADRVRRGGHSVPAPDVRRRFRKGLYNLFHVYRELCDVVDLFDNSSSRPRLVATWKGLESIIIDADTYSKICVQGDKQ